jgi:hypothetical protein
MEPARCPIRLGADVAVTVRGAPRRSPTPAEDGALCALRAGLPLVVTGTTQVSPFEPWADACVPPEDVISATEHASLRPYREAAEAASTALAHAGIDADVAVMRTSAGVRAKLALDPSVTLTTAAALATAAIRRVLPDVKVVDVSVMPITRR